MMQLLVRLSLFLFVLLCAVSVCHADEAAPDQKAEGVEIANAFEKSEVSDKGKENDEGEDAAVDKDESAGEGEGEDQDESEGGEDQTEDAGEDEDENEGEGAGEDEVHEEGEDAEASVLDGEDDGEETGDKEEDQGQAFAEVAKQMLLELDTNSDGKLSKEEYFTGDGAQFDKHIKHVDADKDGLLSVEELIKLEEAFEGEGFENGEQAEREGAEARAKEMMLELDANRDGKISKQEYFLNDNMTTDMTTDQEYAVFDRHMKYADADKDGLLSLEELIKLEAALAEDPDL